MHYIKDTYKKRLDLYFDTLPSEEIRAFLKNEGWHWNKTKRCWFTYLSQQNLETAIALGAGPYQPTMKAHTQTTFLHTSTPEQFTLNALYTPSSISNIRSTPLSTDEFLSHGFSPDDTFEYLRLMHRLYTDAAKRKNGYTEIIYLWSVLVDFCKKHKLIHEAFEENILGEQISDCVDRSFKEFRLQIERFLTETDPSVQFIKCAYDVDVVCFEWWKEYWDPTMCQLGHIRKDKAEFTPLDYNELVLLQSKIRHDEVCGRYSNFTADIFDADFWGQVIFWNMEDFDIPSSFEDSTLYIYKGRIICQTQQHKIVQATAILANSVGADIKLNVNYCTECKKFFMSYTTYQRYRNRYGVILGDLKMLKRDDFIDCEDCLAEESPLHLCGYSVAEKNGLSRMDRQNIIAYVIGRGVMEKEQVISHLGWLINTNEHRQIMQSAVKKWDEDLSFTLQYDMDRQSQHMINMIQKYRANQFKIEG